MMKKTLWALAFVTTIAVAGFGLRSAVAETLRSSQPSEYYKGAYVGNAVSRDDWFFDTYQQPGQQQQAAPWYGQEHPMSKPAIFAGQYDTNYGNDWFFDAYAPAGEGSAQQQQRQQQ